MTNPATPDQREAIRRLRTLDLALVATASPVWVPLLLLTSAAALIFQGRPIFFRQERLGQGGQTFELLKFRTMINDADRYLDEYGQPTRPRITRLGARLRRTGLDELPQLINVLRGNMSLVGPRPLLVSWGDRIPGGTSHPRFRVRPGLTGPAQVEGRNTVLWSRRLQLDEDFATRPTVLTYVKVLAATPAALLRPTVAADRNTTEVYDLAPEPPSAGNDICGEPRER